MSESRQRPRSATVAGGILLLEAVGMVAVAIWITVSALGEAIEHLGGSLFLAVICLATAVFLLQAGRGMLNAAAWSRSAAVVWQVLQVGVALGTYNGAEGPVPIALLLFIPSLVVLILVFRRSMSEWLVREERTY